MSSFVVDWAQNLSLIYSAHMSSSHKFPQNHKISPDTNLQKNHTETSIQTQNLGRISPFGIAPVLAGMVDHSVDLSIPDFEKV